MTVVDILVTVFLLPCYIYLVASNFRLVKEEGKREEEKKNRNAEQGEPAR
jgi:hypothetical protein